MRDRPCYPGVDPRSSARLIWRLALVAAVALSSCIAWPAVCQDTIKVATLNIRRPDLTASTPAARNDTLTHYGKDFLSQADIAFVQEDGDNAWTKVLSDTSGLHFATNVVTTDPHGPDMAIISRFPLSGVVLHPVKGFGFWLEAVATIGSRKLLVITSHYPTGVGPDGNAKRDALSISILDRVHVYGGDVFAGGDLNATDGDVPITRLAFAMWDSLKVAPSPRHCDTVSTPDNQQRVDYLFFDAHYVLTQFDGCQDAKPSDHRMVLGTYRYDPAALASPPHPAATPPPSACMVSCQSRQAACMADAHNGPARAACGEAAQQCRAGCQEN